MRKGSLVYCELQLCPSSCPLFLYSTPPCHVRENVPDEEASAMSLCSPFGRESRQMPPGISIVGNEVKAWPRAVSKHSGAATPVMVSVWFSSGQLALLSKQSGVTAFHQAAFPCPACSLQDNDRLNEDWWPGKALLGWLLHSGEMRLGGALGECRCYWGLPHHSCSSYKSSANSVYPCWLYNQVENESQMNMSVGSSLAALKCILYPEQILNCKCRACGSP